MNWIWNSLMRRKTETRQLYPGSVLKVIFRRGDDGYIIAECPQLPGCMSQGKTKEEAERNIVDAIKSVLIVRMGQFSIDPTSGEENSDDFVEEESFRVNGPELISV